MSRGGRGGGGASRLNGIPFDIDPKLEEEMNAFREGEREDDDDWVKTLYPSMQVDLPPPPNEKEKREVNAWRQHRAAMRNGPFFMDTPLTGKRDLATFNAFEDAATYGNKRTKRTGGLPNLKHLPIVKECLPKELWDVVGDDEDGGEDAEAPRKNLAFLKKKRLDKLAQFDDGADIDAVNVDDDDEQANQDEDGGDGVEIPEDDDFSEDDDDLGNDYNAEKYFDDGDGVDDDGDDGGGEDAW
ncbi:hypothetical protein DOTSEDRAFT_55261 [Dothistroma septosporum NZE10]|uniref:DNA-directed RNA polymerase III subunit n=1 Tax=Dothistroma septosporum (strain NZE10 / CBS 128990) TaxID=675120 RepID=N1PIR1_DOTSN|nr:hypothetical protein DOTSEDRAFT_55261 [Dothistroma septosporum NZE10]